MAQSIEAIKNKEVRGCIMRALALSQFNPISNHALQMGLIEKSTDIMPQVLYLKDKGYIRVDDVSKENLGGIQFVVNLTAKGVDLIEGSITPDPGVSL